MTQPFKQRRTTEQALQKLKHYCAYQERCHQEAKEKLYGMGLHARQVDELISQLIEENYLNEERFAFQYAGGKFRVKQWGRLKIKYALKQKQVSDYCIKKALLQIDEEAYLETLGKLAAEKYNLLKSEPDLFVMKGKLQDFLYRKGFEPDLVKEILDQLK